MPKFGKGQFTIPLGTSAGPAVPLAPVGEIGPADPASMDCDATVKTSWAEIRTRTAGKGLSIQYHETVPR